MLEVKDVHFDYFDKPLLQQVSFSLSKGELLHLKGGNGAGKTTLLKLLAGIHSPAQGQILFQGRSLQEHKKALQAHVSYIGHKLGISQALTVKENLRLNHSNQPFSLTEILKKISLQNLENVPCHLLSAGQKRRVALAQLLIHNTMIWLLDEPYNALDAEGIVFLSGIISEHVSQGGLVIITSHQALPFGLPTKEYILC